MKLRNVKKKIGSLLLAAAMIITSFPASGTEVQAAELMSAAPNYFVTKEQLKTFNDKLLYWLKEVREVPQAERR